MKGQPLEINTERAGRWNEHRTLQERTNSSSTGSNTSDQKTGPFPFTPGTSYTFGVPFTAAIRSPLPPLPSPLLGVNEKELRRIRRYSTAQDVLATTFHNCSSETSPQELQIRALEKATAILAAHARDSRERAEKLQTILADRGIDPATYEALKRERWMEEKRQLAVDQESKALMQQLDILTRSLHGDVSHSQMPDNPSMTKKARREANLVKFLESSQKPIHTYRPSLVSVERSPRRRTVDKVSPMRLRTTSATSRFSDSVGRHLRSYSLDGHKLGFRIPNHVAQSRQNPDTPTNHIHLSVVTEDMVTRSGNTSPSEYTTTTTSHISNPFETSPGTPTTATTSNTPHCITPLSLSPEADDITDVQSGTATIYHDAPHSPSDDVSLNIHAPMPEYAIDLLANFATESALPLKPVFPSLVTQVLNPPRDPRYTCMREPSTLLQAPEPTSSSSSKSKGRLGRSRSYRQLGSLFSIPEALPSRLGFESDEKTSPASSGFFTRSRNDVSATVPIVSAAASPAQPAKTNVGHTTDGVTTRLKKRFSVLRRH